VGFSEVTRQERDGRSLSLFLNWDWFRVKDKSGGTIDVL